MYKVLIADDEHLERQVLTATLKKHLGEDCVFLEAENGREAIRLARAENVHVAVLDVEMPGMNGLEAAAAIKEADEGCQIIFLTAFDDFQYARSAIQVRALDYLLKPWDKNEVLSVVEEALRLADRERRTEERDILESSTDRSELVSERILRFVKDNYMRDISMHDAAGTLGYSDAYFSKLFKQLFDKNFTTYLTEYRMDRARELLEGTERNIKEVGEAVGYYDSNYFTKVFKRYLGVLPSEYRLQEKNG